MAIACANLGAGAAPDIASQTAATSYVSSSWTPPTSGLILVSIYAVKVGGADVPTLSGNSLTWTQIHTRLNGNWRLSLFAANASGSTTGATTISYGANTQLRTLASFSHATGVDLSGGTAAAFVQSVDAVTVANLTGTVTMAAAGHADNRPYSAFSNGSNVAGGGSPVTPRTNWTEFDDLVVTDGGTLETQFRSDAFETTASASVPTTAQTWEGIAVELKADTPQIAFANLGASGAPDFASQTIANSYASASWAPPTSGLILLSIYSVKVGGSDLPTVSGNSLTWVQIGTRLTGNWRMTMFAANASGSTTGATTVSYGGVSQLRCIASFAHATGVDLSGGVAAAIVQQVSGSATAQTSISLTLAAAGAAGNRPYAAFGNGGNVATLGSPVTHRTNWTEFDDLVVSDGGALETQYRSGAFETTASASAGAVQTWDGIAVEIKVESSAVAAAGTWAYIPVAS